MFGYNSDFQTNTFISLLSELLLTATFLLSTTLLTATKAVEAMKAVGREVDVQLVRVKQVLMILFKTLCVFKDAR